MESVAVTEISLFCHQIQCITTEKVWEQNTFLQNEPGPCDNYNYNDTYNYRT